MLGSCLACPNLVLSAKMHNTHTKLHFRVADDRTKVMDAVARTNKRFPIEAAVTAWNSTTEQS